MIPRILQRFRRTRYFLPGRLRLDGKPISPQLNTEYIDLNISEPEAIGALCSFSAVWDREINPDEAYAVNFIYNNWPFFAEYHDNQAKFDELVQKVGELLAIANLGQDDAARLFNSLFIPINKENQSFAFAAVLDVLWSDGPLTPREVELMKILQSRLHIRDSQLRALSRSASLRFH